MMLLTKTLATGARHDRPDRSRRLAAEADRQGRGPVAEPRQIPPGSALDGVAYASLEAEALAAGVKP